MGIVECEGPAAFEYVEGFVHLKVSVNRNARTDRYLLGPKGEIGRACSGARLDEDATGITEVNEVFASVGAEHETLRCGLGRHSSRQ